jgi:hypothetical protein
MGLAGKLEGMSGEMAPVLWAQGKREEVLRYVAQDVKTTLALATACEALGSCPSGKPAKSLAAGRLNGPAMDGISG